MNPRGHVMLGSAWVDIQIFPLFQIGTGICMHDANEESELDVCGCGKGVADVHWSCSISAIDHSAQLMNPNQLAMAQLTATKLALCSASLYHLKLS